MWNSTGTLLTFPTCDNLLGLSTSIRSIILEQAIQQLNEILPGFRRSDFQPLLHLPDLHISFRGLLRGEGFRGDIWGHIIIIYVPR